MTNEKLKHLEFIQNIITRMNSTSFQIKSWTITIVTALLGVYASTTKIDFIFLAILPTIFFWCLDTYYLMQERKFRGLYNDVAGVSEEPNQIKLFEINTELYKGGTCSYWNVLRSTTIFLTYFPIVVVLLIAYFYLR